MGIFLVLLEKEFKDGCTEALRRYTFMNAKKSEIKFSGQFQE
jgi:hypothetical protein